jgi:hypothetical protein
MRPLRNLTDLANMIGIPCVLLYIYSMLIYLWFTGNFNWNHVHEVWENWQTFNAALLAFLASWFALNIARARDERQRQKDEDQRRRDYFATSALLPAAFSELSSYFTASAAVLNGLWEEVDPPPKAPEPATFYREIFQNCIKHADLEVAQYLKQILVDLQIHEARLESITSADVSTGHHALISHAYSLAKLKVAIDKQYQFARDEEPFDATLPVWDDFRNAYSILGIAREDYVTTEFDLTGLTNKRLSKLAEA